MIEKHSNNEISIPKKIDWKKEVIAYQNDKEWRLLSEKISIAILRLLRKKNKNKAWLAAQLKTTPQYVSKLVKGTENLNLKTIAKIQTVFEERIFEIKNIDAPSDSNFIIIIGNRVQEETGVLYLQQGNNADLYSIIQSTAGSLKTPYLFEDNGSWNGFVENRIENVHYMELNQW